MRHAVLCLATAVSLWGCSNTTTIHLHPQTLTPSHTASLTEELEHKGFAVEIEDNAAPAAGNTIIYSPQKNIEQQLNSITKILQRHNIAVDQIFVKDSGGGQSERLGRHTYTAGHIGVYLADNNIGKISRGAKVRSTFPINMIGYEFVSSDCDTDYMYEFFESGDLVVTNINSLAEDLGKHTWHQEDDNIIIRSMTGSQYKYTKSKGHSVYQTSDPDLEVVAYTIKLSPAGFYPLPYSCSYTATFKEGFDR